MWLSILKTTQSPSPMSTTPAFSPGPWITCGPLVGSVRSHFFDDLYEQCSFHMAEKDAELGEGRFAAEKIEDALVFVRLQPVRGDQLAGDLHVAVNGHLRLSGRFGGQIACGAKASGRQGWPARSPR